MDLFLKKIQDHAQNMVRMQILKVVKLVVTIAYA